MNSNHASERPAFAPLHFFASISCVWLAIAACFTSAAQTNYVVPSDNLVVESIPPIPVALADQIGRYTEFRSAPLNTWHPKRREMLVVTRFAEAPQVHLVDRPGGARTQLTFFRDRSVDPSFQPTEGNYFLFSRDNGGNEQFQKYRYDVASRQITLLTDGKSRNTGGVWSNNGDEFVYGSTRRNGQDVDFWMIHPPDPKSDRMVAQLKGGGWQPLDFSPDDRKLLVLEEVSANESFVWLFDIKSGERTQLTPKVEGQTVAYGHAQFSKDGKGFYVSTDLGSEFLRLAYVDLRTLKHTFLSSHISWNVEHFELSKDGKTIAFLVNEDGRGVLHLMDVRGHRERPKPELPGSVIGLIWHNNSRDLGLAIESARQGADSYCLDVKSGKLERWTSSETGPVDTAGFAEPELVRWKTFDERMISGWLYRPPARFTGKRPVLVYIHGGPESQARLSFQGANNYYVNELGIAMIQPNVRGSSGYGKTFLKLDNGFLRENTYKDIAALFDWIKSRPDLDADRIMVMGGSYGGHMTLAMATWYPERIRCALDIVGISSLVTFLENTSAYRRDLRRVEYGDERDPKMREFLNRIAPLNNADKITKPLFVVQGGNDPRVPLSESVQIVQTLRNKGTPVWYLMAKDEGHGFAKKKNRDFQLYSTVLFMQEYLLK